MYPNLRGLQMPCRLEQLVELDHLSMMCHASPSMGATVTAGTRRSPLVPTDGLPAAEGYC